MLLARGLVVLTVFLTTTPTPPFFERDNEQNHGVHTLLQII